MQPVKTSVPGYSGNVLVVDPDHLGPAELVQRHGLELDSEIPGDHLTTGQDGNALGTSPCDDRRNCGPSEEKVSMSVLAGEDVRSILGPVDDDLVARILATGATREELAEAYAWLSNDEAPMNSGQPLASGRVAELIGLLEESEEDSPPSAPG
jgi:hypothetical protein